MLYSYVEIIFAMTLIFIPPAPPTVPRYDWTGYQNPVPLPPARASACEGSDDGFEGGPPDRNDEMDYEDGNRGSDVLEALIKDLENLDTMTGPNLARALSDLPVPKAGKVPGMSVAEAIAVTVSLSYSWIDFKVLIHIYK